MSDSPKYTHAELAAQRRRELEAERRRQAAQEEARRAAAEQRRQQQRLQELRTGTQQQVRSAVATVTAFATAATGKFADQQAVQRVRKQLASLEAGLSRSGESELRSTEKRVAQLERELTGIQDAAQRREQASSRVLGELETASESLRHAEWNRAEAERLMRSIAELRERCLTSEPASIQSDWKRTRKEVQKFNTAAKSAGRLAGSIGKALTKTESSLQKLLKSTSSSFVADIDRSTWSRQVNALRAGLDNAADLDALSGVQQQVAELDVVISRADSEAVALAASVENARRVVGEVGARVARITQPEVARFADDGLLQAVRSGLADVSARLSAAGAGFDVRDCDARIENVNAAMRELESRSGEVLAAAESSGKLIDSVLKQLASLKGGELTQWLTGDALQRVDDDLNSLRGRFQSAGSVAELEEIRRDGTSLAAAVEEIATTAEMARLAENLGRLKEQLVDARSRFEAADARRAEKFDVAGHRSSREQLEQAERLIATQDLQGATRAAAAATRQVTAHLALVDERFAAWEADRLAAEEQLKAATDQADALETGDLTSQLTTLLQRLDQLREAARTALGSEDFAACRSRSSEMQSLAGDIEYAARLWRRFGQVSAATEELNRELALRHDAAGYREVRQQLSQASNALQSGQPANAEDSLSRCEDGLKDHQQKLEQHIVEWRRARDAAQAAVQNVEAAWLSLSNDPDCDAADEKRRSVVQGRVARLQERVTQEQFEAAERESAAVLSEVETLAREVQLAVRVRDVARSSDEFGSDVCHLLDQSGSTALEQQILRVQQLLTRGDLAAVENQLSRIEQQAQRHTEVVQAGIAEWNRRSADAEEKLAALEDRIAGLEADEVVMRWAQVEVDEFRKETELLGAQLDDGQFDGVESSIKAIDERIKELIPQVQEVQLAEDERQFIVDGITGVMRGMGFDIPEDPATEDANDPMSATLISASQSDGRRVSISVPQDRAEDVWYEVEGFEMQAGMESGQLVRTCDSASGQIKGIHDQLRALGIEMSELWWEGKPERIEKAADELPRAEPKTREIGG